MPQTGKEGSNGKTEEEEEKEGQKRRQNKKYFFFSLSEEDTRIRYKQFQTGIIITYSDWRSHFVPDFVDFLSVQNSYQSTNMISLGVGGNQQVNLRYTLVLEIISDEVFLSAAVNKDTIGFMLDQNSISLANINGCDGYLGVKG